MRYRCLSFDSRPSRFHVDTACVVELLCSGALTLQDIREVSPPSCRSNMFYRVSIPQLYVTCHNQHRKHVGKHVIV